MSNLIPGLRLRENILLMLILNVTTELLIKGGAPVNLEVFDFLVKVDFLGVFDTFPAEALPYFIFSTGYFDILDVFLFLKHKHLLEID